MNGRANIEKSEKDTERDRFASPTVLGYGRVLSFELRRGLDCMVDLTGSNAMHAVHPKNKHKKHENKASRSALFLEDSHEIYTVLLSRVFYMHR